VDGIIRCRNYFDSVACAIDCKQTPAQPLALIPEPDALV
jgi:hypothetical protein